MSNPRERYFRWLLKEIDYDEMKKRAADYSYLLRYLFEREFYWDVPHDDNRAADGVQLRIIAGINADLGRCSILEMMVALARRIDKEILPDFDNGENAGRWFWMMIENCGASKYDNGHWNAEEVAYIFSSVLYRGYEFDGSGGFFPLKNAEKDQRKVELWYQMQSYLIDNFTF